MCTKAVSVNVRSMSDKLKVPIVVPCNGKDPFEIAGGSALPTDLTPVITLDRPREIQFMRWGLVPSDADDPKNVGTMFNARAETLLQLKSFRGLVSHHRCLILNEGFIERETQGNEKVEWLFSPAEDGEYFYKAGLWTRWQSRDKRETIESFTMITCNPLDSIVGKYHDRMPVILNKEQRRLWMHPQASINQLMELLRPCDDKLLKVTEYSRKPVKNLKGRNSGDSLFSKD